MVCIFRFLATGETYTSLAMQFRVGTSTISRLVPEVCDVIWDVMNEEWLKLPSTVAEWKSAAADFESKHHHPHCVGAIDGKHITLIAPNNAGSMFYNYKGTHSIVLMAVADANLRFSYIDVGAYGRSSDGGIFSSCSFGEALVNGELGFPADEKVPNVLDGPELPYVFVADEAFPLDKHIMRPFPGRGMTHKQRVFNYRQSRARRVVECSFGILAARWRVFHTKIAIHPKRAIKVVKAACVLHNFLQKNTTSQTLATDTACPDQMQDIAHVGYRGTNDAIWVREMFADHFHDNSTPEMTRFQNNHITQTG